MRLTSLSDRFFLATLSRTVGGCGTFAKLDFALYRLFFSGILARFHFQVPVKWR